MQYRLKAGLKLQKVSNEKKVNKVIYFLEHPTGRRTSCNCLNMYLLVDTDKVIAAEGEREWQQIGRKKQREWK